MPSKDPYLWWVKGVILARDICHRGSTLSFDGKKPWDMLAAHYGRIVLNGMDPPPLVRWTVGGGMGLIIYDGSGLVKKMPLVT